MSWQRVSESYETRRRELENELSAAAGQGPGSLDLPADWSYPDYYDQVHYHRQPGGYHADRLAGYVYHYGTKVFHAGANDHDEAKSGRIWELPEPADGRVERVLDIGAAIGSGTTEAARRWPAAEVWGIDASAPLLAYAHARAVRLGLAVHFAQRLAEDNRFPDASMDLIYLSTVLHEVPREVGREVLREARRVVRPGGVLVVNDMNPAADPPEAWADYDRWFDARFNNEPYAYTFVYADVREQLDALFDDVEVVRGERMSTWTCRA